MGPLILEKWSCSLEIIALVQLLGAFVNCFLKSDEVIIAICLLNMTAAVVLDVYV